MTRDERSISNPTRSISAGLPMKQPAGPVEDLSGTRLNTPKRIWFAISRFLAVVGLSRQSSTPLKSQHADHLVNKMVQPVHDGHDAGDATTRSVVQTSIAQTSHELRTPLNGILGMADLLARTPLSPEQANYVKAITTSASALLSLVDNMLDASKLAAGRWKLQPQPVDLEDLVAEVVELLAPRAQAKGLELGYHVARQVPSQVMADPDQLSRVLMNLTGNAIKFTDVGGVAIEVAVEREQDETAWLIFSVRDSGIGIAPEDQARVFAEYEQADGQLVRRAGGTGLGLSISKAIARAMDGDITLESNLGLGSVFHLRVACRVLQAAQRPDNIFTGRQILLVSDRSVEPSLLMRRLFDLGASVELTRTDGTNTVLADRAIDAILLDHAPGRGIPPLLRDPPKSSPPIAVLLAPADRAALAGLRETGIVAHLVRPVRTSSLIKVLKALLSGGIQAIKDAPDEIIQSPVDDHSGPARGIRILLADDNAINILLGQSLLRTLGYASDVAKDGTEAVAAVVSACEAGESYDVILMDLHMPKIDGFMAIDLIRQHEVKSRSRTVIIALTADTSEQTALRARQAGADFALTKPLQQTDLSAILNRVASQRGSANGSVRSNG